MSKKHLQVHKVIGEIMTRPETVRIVPDEAYEAFYASNGFRLEDHSIMMCRRGSQTHGTDNEHSDEDYFGVVVPPVERLIGLSQFDNWKYPEEKELDVNIFSFRKYVGLLIKNNPTVLETLWLRRDDYCNSGTKNAFRVVMQNRAMFSSLRAYHAFSGYAYDQLKRMTKGATNARMGAKRKAIVDKYGYDTKNASHLLRLYRMGIEFVETGELTVYRPDREELLAVKNGEWTLEAVKTEAEILHERMRNAKETSPLPKQPDISSIEKLMVGITWDYMKYQENFS